MSVIVYREGASHNIKGVQCEQQLIAPEFLDSHLINGWYLEPGDIPYEPLPEPEIDIDDLSNGDIRELARIKGHELSDTARIDTLKRFLTDDGS